MHGRYDFTFWQNSPSIHQAPLMSSLAADGLKVRVVVPTVDNVARQAMGWPRPDYGDAILCTTEGTTGLRSLAESAREDRAHVFTGLGSNPAVSAAFRTLAAGPHGHLSVMTESWDPRGPKGVLRRVRYTRRVLQWRRYIDSVLATGTLAGDQFTNAGIPAERIFQFMYSVADIDHPPERHGRSVPMLMFVGSLEPHKDPLLLVEAVSSLRGLELTIVGSGGLRDEVHRAILRHGIEDRVRVVDRLDNGAVRSLIARSDLLVLPSRYDGWGAVTNEALMAGTPAVVSDAAGSSILVANSNRGQVFRSGDVRALRKAVLSELVDRPSASARREGIRQWSRNHISPAALARYLRRALLEDPRATAPWLEEEVAR